jgi:serine phosphatase RsbU (regulator of sigma subunit)
MADTLPPVVGEPRGRFDLGRMLAAVEDAPPVAAADVVGALLGEAVDATDVAFLIADFNGDALIRLGHTRRSKTTRAQGQETADRVPLTAGVHGRALASQQTQIERADRYTRLVVPVTNRGDAVGVLELLVPEPPDERSLADVALAAHALAYVVIANRRFTDLFEWGQRSVPLNLAAEIQHWLLPAAPTCEAGQFSVAAWLEPSNTVAGDTFDFTLDRGTLQLSITDAMGHAVNAAMMATLMVNALRNARRAGVGLAAQADRAGREFALHAHAGQFVTGQLLHVDLGSQTASVVNAGHPPPFRLRGGHVDRVRLYADLPFGIAEGGYREQPVPLAVGDRLVFLTDGMLERSAGSANMKALIEETAPMHPRELVQHLVHAISTASGGELDDDATVICLDWHGGPPRSRTSDFGSDRRPASPAHELRRRGHRRSGPHEIGDRGAVSQQAIRRRLYKRTRWARRHRCRQTRPDWPKTRGAKGIRTPDLLPAEHHLSVRGYPLEFRIPCATSTLRVGRCTGVPGSSCPLADFLAALG